MRGDFSRRSFNPTRHYTSVLQQQGRVALDADANEQCAIDEYIRDTEITDIVGPVGGPRDDAGFDITTDGKTISFSAGRYYVDGILCENESALQYQDQPYLLSPDPTDSELLVEARRGAIPAIQVYLEVWQRLITALDDPCLREPALGLPDTTARLQTVWRVVARASTEQQEPCCSMTWPDPTSAKGKLAAQTSGAAGECSCQPIPSAGYLGLENQLYRVEIQKSGDETTATFKWSRENGSVVAAITGVSGNVVQVDSLGFDANLGFASGQWIEISDDTDLFGLNPVPGNLYQIDKVIPEQKALRMTLPVSIVDTKKNARARRWDQSGASAKAAGVPLSAETWVSLENGIQVKFTKGFYQAGDYALIPARTASGQIEWPPCGGDGALQQPLAHPRIHRAPLACVSWDRSKKAWVRQDCRSLFDPLTDLAARKVPPALHVMAINWPNDDILTLDWLMMNGLAVTLDAAAPAQATVGAANFTVTFELALPITSTQREISFNKILAAQPLVAEHLAAATSLLPEAMRAAALSSATSASRVLNARLSAAEILARRLSTLVAVYRFDLQLDGEIISSGSTLTWKPFTAFRGQAAAVLLLNGLLLFGASHQAPSTGQQTLSRVRVRLEGRTLFSTVTSGQAFLDGQAFGTSAVRADNVTPRINLQLPSGNSEKASDFESWFYLAPTLAVVSLAIDHPSVQFNADGTVSDLGHATPAVSPQATLTLNYAAVKDTVITLSISGPSSAGVISPLTTLTIKSGSATGQFPVQVIGNTGTSTIQSYSINAQLTDLTGSTSEVSAQFSVTGFVVIG